MGFGETVPAFLDRTLKPIDLLHGVSFASASSGYDDLTANFSVKKKKKNLKYYIFFFFSSKKIITSQVTLIFVESISTVQSQVVT